MVRMPVMLIELEAASVVLRASKSTVVVGFARADQPRQRRRRPERSLIRLFGLTIPSRQVNSSPQ